MKRIIEIETKQWGQPKPYADHIYEGVITFRKENGTWIPEEEEVKRIAKSSFANWSDEPNWNDPYLKELKALSESSWYVVVIQPFLD